MHHTDDSRQFPSGRSVRSVRSVRNARRDAKRLARSAGLSLSAAQDQIARDNGCQQSWARAMPTLPKPGASLIAQKNSVAQMSASHVHAILEREPWLTRFGHGPSDHDVREHASYRAAIAAGQRDLLDHLDECNKALRFLLHVEKRKTVNPRLATSYGLKHFAEHYLRQVDVDRPEDHYISNGAFICAALHAGFSMKASFEDGPNVRFNMSLRSPVFEWRRVERQSTFGDPRLAARKARLAQLVGVRGQ